MKYKCPCCGYYTYLIPVKQAPDEICPVCFWENDVFISTEGEPSACNHGLTLTEGRANFKDFGACEKAMLKHVRPPYAEELTPE